MSILAWIAFSAFSVVVLIHYIETKDFRFLMYAIPGLIFLIVIPMTLAWMSRKSFAKAETQYGQNARVCKIGKITPAILGEIVNISGEVQKISFKWLNRPHYHVKDDTGIIRVIMFTAPAESIQRGVQVAAMGTVVRNIFNRSNPAISAVSIKKLIPQTKTKRHHR